VAVSIRIVDENLAPWPEAPVALEWSKVGVGSTGYAVVVSGRNEIPGQADDLDGDGRPDELFLLLDLQPDEASRITITSTPDAHSYPSRTQAIVAVRQGGAFDDGLYVGGSDFEPVDFVNVPNDQEQDSDWARFEGPVWESDLIGFRFYLDDRYRTDIFGKRTPDMVLHSVQGDYHTIGGWGADILKVGSSLGLGSPAVLIDSTLSVIDNATSRTVEVVASGPLRSIIRTTHTGWVIAESEVNVVSELEIRAGQRWTEQRLAMDGLQEDARLATGIARHPAASELYTGEVAGVLYMYTWGAQSDQGNDLGMAVLVPKRFDPVVDETDPTSHVVTFLADDGEATYRYMAAWELEPTPIPDRETFESAIRLVASRWAAGTEVTWE
ncbi:MAG: DUF4861 family protein, partial [Rhodothermia bacterium]